MKKKIKLNTKIIFLIFFIFSYEFLVAKDQLIKSKMVDYYTNDTGVIKGYLAQPKLAQPKNKNANPGILLIHEWWGLNQDMKNQADNFAKLGYVALAVDLYQGKNTQNPAVARKLATMVKKNQKIAFENLKGALKYIKNINGIDKSRLASIGWCFGGGWSYQIAKNNLGVKASVIYYGRFNPKDDLEIMKAEIIGHFADKDRSISIDLVNQFEAKLKTINGNHEIYIYPNTQHGFASRKGKNNQYNQKQANIAWKRTISFLKRKL